MLKFWLLAITKPRWGTTCSQSKVQRTSNSQLRHIEPTRPFESMTMKLTLHRYKSNVIIIFILCVMLRWIERLTLFSQSDKLWEVHDAVARSESLFWVARCPENFNRVGNFSVIDNAVARNTLQGFLCGSQTKSCAVEPGFVVVVSWQPRQEVSIYTVPRCFQIVYDWCFKHTYLVLSPSISITKLTTTNVEPPSAWSLSMSGMYSWRI